MKLKTEYNIEGPRNAERQWFLYDITQTLDIKHYEIAEAAGVSTTRVSDLFDKGEKPTKAEREAFLKCILKKAAHRKDEIIEMVSV